MSTSSDDDHHPRPPRAEPEILPPEAPDPRRRAPEPGWTRQRVYIARPGPFAMILGLLVLVALLVAGVVAIAGITLLLLPGVALIVGVMVLAALLRGPRRL